MNKKQLILLQLVLLSSPIILGYVYGLTQPSDSVYGIVILFAVVFGWPFILITGAIVSIMTRRSKKTQTYSVIGYIAPTIFVLLWQFGSLQ